MGTGDLFDSQDSGVKGWGFLRSTLKKRGLDPQEFEGYWLQLTAQEYSFKEMTMNNLERKWEAVSAVQKATRRGDSLVAQRAASALINTGDYELMRYLWRRVCTTAIEDVALANPPLLAFTLACAESFTPSKFPALQKPVIYWLLGAMAASLKDRTPCNMSVVWSFYAEAAEEVRAEYDKTLSGEGKHLAWAISDHQSYEPTNPIAHYVVGQQWRTEGMGAFFPLAQTLQDGEHHVLKPELMPSCMIMGLPSYAYDVHTKVGKCVMARLSGYADAKALFDKYGCRDRMKAVGWAVFYLEGCQIDQELDFGGHSDLIDLERKLAFMSLGVAPEGHAELLNWVSARLLDGTVNNLRKQEVSKNYA